MEYVIGVCLNGLQLLASLWFFDAYFVKKRQGAGFWGTALVWLILECVILYGVGTILSPVKAVITPLIFLILNLFLYEGALLFRVFISVVVYLLFNAFAYMLEFAVMTAFSLDREMFVYNKVLYTLTGLAGTLCMLLFARAVKYFHTPIKEGHQNRNWTLMALFFPISSILVLLLLYSGILNEERQEIFAMICLCIMAIANILILELMNILKKSAQEHEMLVAISERERQQQESVTALSAAYQGQRRLTHDFQKHLSVLARLLEQEQTAQAAHYLRQIQEQQTSRILLVNTHHAVMDAILNQKGYKAQGQQIDIQFEVNDLSGIRICPADCTVVLGNLLDNAIEACQKLPAQKRWIRVSVLHNTLPNLQSKSVFMSVLNPSLPVKIVNRSIATTKPDASCHGFGLHNVKSILEKYGAEYDLAYEHGQFVFSVDWPDTPL